MNKPIRDWRFMPRTSEQAFGDFRYHTGDWSGHRRSNTRFLVGALTAAFLALVAYAAWTA